MTVTSPTLKPASANLISTPYEAFRDTLRDSNCLKCSLSKSRTKIVVDRGNPAARVVIVGEAPGASEDQAGFAFVGRSGKLLDAMMSEAGFDTNRDALIINVVKCRPPGNRPPAREEAASCRPYLDRQLELVRPRFFVLLGATALRHMLPGKKNFSMSAEVGRFFSDPSYPGAEIIVFFHPAYILRDPRKKPLMAEHIRSFAFKWKAAV